MYNEMNKENKIKVIKRLVKEGFGLPKAIEVYNKLSADGFYEVDKTELNKWIKENGFQEVPVMKKFICSGYNYKGESILNVEIEAKNKNFAVIRFSRMYGNICTRADEVEEDRKEK